MGAKITGSGTSTITIVGVDELEAVSHRTIPDRIQAATFMAAVGVAGGQILLEHARYDHMNMVCQKVGRWACALLLIVTVFGLWPTNG